MTKGLREPIDLRTLDALLARYDEVPPLEAFSIERCATAEENSRCAFGNDLCSTACRQHSHALSRNQPAVYAHVAGNDVDRALLHSEKAAGRAP